MDGNSGSQREVVARQVMAVSVHSRARVALRLLPALHVWDFPTLAPPLG
jgi:hypothetical protein